MTEPVSQPAAAAAAPGPDALILELGKVLQQLGRNDLAGRAAVAAARLRRPSRAVGVAMIWFVCGAAILFVAVRWPRMREARRAA